MTLPPDFGSRHCAQAHRHFVVAHPARTFGECSAEAGAGAMLVACRLAGLSALEPHYADDNAQAQSGVEEQVREPRPTRPREVRPPLA